MDDVVVGQPATRTNTSAKNALSLTTGRSEGVPKVCRRCVNGVLNLQDTQCGVVRGVPKVCRDVPIHHWMLWLPTIVTVEVCVVGDGACT
jgi:hypothetical protein